MIDLVEFEKEASTKTLDELKAGGHNISQKLTEMEMVANMANMAGMKKEFRQLRNIHMNLKEALAIVSRKVMLKGVAYGELTAEEHADLTKRLDEALEVARDNYKRQCAEDADAA